MYIPEPSLRDPSHPDGWLPPSCVAGHPFLTDMGSVLQVQTFYEKMFLEMGLPITYMAFVIDHGGPYAFPGEAFDHDYWLEAEGPPPQFLPSAAPGSTCFAALRFAAAGRVSV